MILSPGFVAFARFGYGPRGSGDVAEAARDPREFLKSALARPDVALLADAGLPSTETVLQSLFAYQKEKKLLRKQPAEAPAEGKATEQGQSTAAGEPAAPPQQAVYRAEALARARRAIKSPASLAERLVAFWSNHFCVSAGKGPIGRITAGAFEREAIRPHILGNFGELAHAVATHPAMLHYLDNAQSIGPDSKLGRRRSRGLNENFAREMMELHILGVDSGYSQKDVLSLAETLTGWTTVRAEGARGKPGTFVFDADAHEPGARTILGRNYAQEGFAQGEAVLNDLVHHPAAPAFIAGKFARHFVADHPSPALVGRLADVFRKSNGDLKAMTFALIDSEEAWSAPLTKIRNPYEFLVATHRAFDIGPREPRQVLAPLDLLGMGLWTPPGPNGYPDDAASWASPEGFSLRLDFAAQFAARMDDPADPLERYEAIVGPAGSQETRQAIARAESREQGLALLLMSPEMQRR